MLLTSSVHARTPKEDKGVIVKKSKNLVYEAPEWVQPVQLYEAEYDVKEWLKILPYEKDRLLDQYIIIPTLGVVAPIQKIPETSTDFQLMRA